jgi:hypothetical protein
VRMRMRRWCTADGGHVSRRCQTLWRRTPVKPQPSTARDADRGEHEAKRPGRPADIEAAITVADETYRTASASPSTTSCRSWCWPAISYRPIPGSHRVAGSSPTASVATVFVADQANSCSRGGQASGIEVEQVNIGRCPVAARRLPDARIPTSR